MVLMVLWMFIGLVAGGLTGGFMRRRGYGHNWGLWLDMLLGAGSASVGGIIIRSSAFIDQGETSHSIVVALAAAVVLTALNGLVGGRC